MQRDNLPPQWKSGTTSADILHRADDVAKNELLPALHAAGHGDAFFAESQYPLQMGYLRVPLGVWKGRALVLSIIMNRRAVAGLYAETMLFTADLETSITDETLSYDGPLRWESAEQVVAEVNALKKIIANQ